MHIEYAAKRIVAAWGIKKSGSRIMNSIKEAVSRCEKERLLRKKGDFLWSIESAVVSVRVPDQNISESLRKIEHIPPEEIESAILLIVRQAVGISVESLLVETARLFGFDRTGENIRTRLFKVYQLMRQNGSIVQNGEMVTLA